jgi:HlyD family secretion protein
VLVRIHNENGLLRPGMNTEVEIHVGQRDSVLAVPNAALRTQRDVGSAAQVLGLSPDAVQQQLATTGRQAGSSAGASVRGPGDSTEGADSARRGHRDSTGARTGPIRETPGDSTAAPRLARGGAGGGQGGGQRGSGGPGGPGGQRGFGGAGRRAARGTEAGGGRYIVFVKRNGAATPVWIRTGLTDLDYSEVLNGLTQGDSVYVLPSASLVQSQQDMKQRVNQITGGGGVPGMRQTTPSPPGGGGRATPAR